MNKQSDLNGLCVIAGGLKNPPFFYLFYSYLSASIGFNKEALYAG